MAGGGARAKAVRARRRRRKRRWHLGHVRRWELVRGGDVHTSWR